MAQGRPHLGRPQAVILILVGVALLDRAQCSANSYDKDDDLCRAAGGVCKVTTECSMKVAQISGQLCRGHNLICCKQTAKNEASEERITRIKKRATIMRKKPYLNKLNSKKSLANGRKGNKLINKPKTDSASKTRTNFKKKEKKRNKKACKKSKKCKADGGKCKKRKKGCKDGEITQNRLCKGSKCVCCTPASIPEPPKQCPNTTECIAENGYCIPKSENCRTGFKNNYVLCGGSYCKCCIGPDITAKPDQAVTPPAPIRYPECPKSPDGSSQTCLECGIANGPAPEGLRVFGGVEVDVPNKYPWLVWLQYRNSHWCGGSIINSQFVLTAAQCLYLTCTLLPAQAIRVIIADHNRTSKLDDVQGITCTVEAQELIPHPDYQICSYNVHENDIALVKLSVPLSLATDNVLRPICLPTSSSEAYLGVSAIMAGWGLTSLNTQYPDLPHEISITVIQTSSCKRFWYWSDNLMICAGATNQAKDACAGDAGGPLIAEVTQGRYSVIGIVSGGDPQCKGPGVYTRVNKYLDWIKNTANLINICP